MSPRTLFTVAGATWGALLGLATTLAVAAFGLGISWLFIFGDDPWPEFAGTSVLLVSFAVGLVVFLSCLITGRRYGMTINSMDPKAYRQARRRGIVLLLLAVGLGLALTLLAYRQHEATESDRVHRNLQTLALQDFSSRVQRISAIRLDPAAPATRIVIDISFAGKRTGEYDLFWQFREPTYGHELLTGRGALTLEPEHASYRISLDLNEIKRLYRDRVLSGDGAVLVDQDFDFQARLTPLLNATERQALPVNEVHNLGLGDSDLISRASMAIPITFTLP